MEKEILIDFGERLHVLLYTQVRSSAQCCGLTVRRPDGPVWASCNPAAADPPVSAGLSSGTDNRLVKQKKNILMNSHEIRTSKFTTGIH